jgi:hypothetical protein
MTDQAAPRAQSTLPAPAKAGAGRFKRLRSRRKILQLGVCLSTGVFVVRGHGSGLAVAVAEAHGTPGASLAYRDGPPLGFSGGFGEDHCQACHSDDKVNATPGSLTISAPERYSPGKTYQVTLTLKKPGMKVGGFQLTARFERDSAQAGTLSLVDGQQARVKVAKDRGVQYAHHLRPGTQLTASGVVRWTLKWTAPAGRGAVLFHAAANAANGDDSQFGDFVYTARTRSRSR